MAQEIEVVRGTSNSFKIAVTDANGEPYILADGEKLRFGVKRNPKDKEELISRTIMLMYLDPDRPPKTDGVYTLKLHPHETAELEYGRYVYDVGLESGEDYYSVIKTSPFVVLPNVTKWGDGV